ncbi:uncharacterized protein ACIBXB_018968 [Morphnus guianensis]
MPPAFAEGPTIRRPPLSARECRGALPPAPRCNRRQAVGSPSRDAKAEAGKGHFPLPTPRAVTPNLAPGAGIAAGVRGQRGDPRHRAPPKRGGSTAALHPAEARPVQAETPQAQPTQTPPPQTLTSMYCCQTPGPTSAAGLSRPTVPCRAAARRRHTRRLPTRLHKQAATSAHAAWRTLPSPARGPAAAHPQTTPAHPDARTGRRARASLQEEGGWLPAAFFPPLTPSRGSQLVARRAPTRQARHPPHAQLRAPLACVGMPRSKGFGAGGGGGGRESATRPAAPRAGSGHLPKVWGQQPGARTGSTVQSSRTDSARRRARTRRGRERGTANRRAPGRRARQTAQAGVEKRGWSKAINTAADDEPDETPGPRHHPDAACGAGAPRVRLRGSVSDTVPPQSRVSRNTDNPRATRSGRAGRVGKLRHGPAAAPGALGSRNVQAARQGDVPRSVPPAEPPARPRALPAHGPGSPPRENDPKDLCGNVGHGDRAPRPTPDPEAAAPSRSRLPPNIPQLDPQLHGDLHLSRRGVPQAPHDGVPQTQGDLFPPHQGSPNSRVTSNPHTMESPNSRVTSVPHTTGSPNSRVTPNPHTRGPPTPG